jgi:hypothetical protein
MATDIRKESLDVANEFMRIAPEGHGDEDDDLELRDAFAKMLDASYDRAVRDIRKKLKEMIRKYEGMAMRDYECMSDHLVDSLGIIVKAKTLKEFLESSMPKTVTPEPEKESVS